MQLNVKEIQHRWKAKLRFKNTESWSKEHTKSGQTHGFFATLKIQQPKKEKAATTTMDSGSLQPILCPHISHLQPRN